MDVSIITISIVSFYKKNYYLYYLASVISKELKYNHERP